MSCYMVDKLTIIYIVQAAVWWAWVCYGIPAVIDAATVAWQDRSKRAGCSHA